MGGMKILRVFAAMCMLAAAALTASHGTLPAAEAAESAAPTLIRLQSEPVGISPSPATVKLGATVIWYNNGTEPVTIKFITRIGIACQAPVNFYGDLLGNYETTKIPQGGTASICLISEGTYEYEVRRLVSKGTEDPFELVSKGTILSVK